MKNYYKLAIKYFIETNNKEQLAIVYKEIENYLEHYYQYEWFYNFNPKNIPLNVYNRLSDENK